VAGAKFLWIWQEMQYSSMVLLDSCDSASSLNALSRGGVEHETAAKSNNSADTVRRFIERSFFTNLFSWKKVYAGLPASNRRRAPGPPRRVNKPYAVSTSLSANFELSIY